MIFNSVNQSVLIVVSYIRVNLTDIERVKTCFDSKYFDAEKEPVEFILTIIQEE